MSNFQSPASRSLSCVSSPPRARIDGQQLQYPPEMKVIENYTSAWQTINGHQMPNINIWWRIINQIWNHVKQHLPQTKCCLVNSRRCACLASFKNLKPLLNNSLLEISKIKIFKIPFCSEEYSTEEYPARCQLHSTVN